MEWTGSSVKANGCLQKTPCETLMGRRPLRKEVSEGQRSAERMCLFKWLIVKNILSVRVVLKKNHGKIAWNLQSSLVAVCKECVSILVGAGCVLLYRALPVTQELCLAGLVFACCAKARRVGPVACFLCVPSCHNWPRWISTEGPWGRGRREA